MLQSILAKRIERLSRWRLFYEIHLALFGLMLAGVALSADPSHWPLLAYWLPILLAHTAVQGFVELRERRLTYELAPVENYRRTPRPVDLYDEDGHRIDG